MTVWSVVLSFPGHTLLVSCLLSLNRLKQTESAVSSIAHSSLAIMLLRKRELVALLCLFLVAASALCFFFMMPRVSLQSVIVAFPGHTHLLFVESLHFNFGSIFQMILIH